MGIRFMFAISMPFVTASLQPHPTRSWAVRSDKTRGSHQQFKHPRKPGLVTIAGSGDDDLAPGTLNGILEQAGLKNRGQKWVPCTATSSSSNRPHPSSAYSPDLPGRVATGATQPEVERTARATPSSSISTASGPTDSPVPPPHTAATLVEVAA